MIYDLLEDIFEMLCLSIFVMSIIVLAVAFA